MAGRVDRHRVDGIGPPRAGLLGPWHEGEFALVRGEIDPAGQWPLAQDWDDARSWLQGAAAPEVVLVAQPRPGVWSQEAVDAWQAAAPLSRVVIVAGAWCEGELRSGRPLAGVLRLYWHQLPAWWRAALRERSAGRAPRWSEPALRVPAPHAWPSGARAPSTVAVDAKDVSVLEALSAALGPLGAVCRWTPRGRGDCRGATAGVWDGGQLDDAEQIALQAFRGRLPAGASLVALVDYPRVEHWSIARQAGVAAILGKPYLVETLIDALGEPARAEHGTRTRGAAPA